MTSYTKPVEPVGIVVFMILGLLRDAGFLASTLGPRVLDQSRSPCSVDYAAAGSCYPKLSRVSSVVARTVKLMPAADSRAYTANPN